MSHNDYTALVSPDAYRYLDETSEDELLHDRLLEEQEEMEDGDIFDEDEEEVPAEETEDTDDSDMYSVSLFDGYDEDDAESEDEVPRAYTDYTEDRLMFSDDENDDIVVSEDPVQNPEPAPIQNQNTDISFVLDTAGAAAQDAESISKQDADAVLPQDTDAVSPQNKESSAPHYASETPAETEKKDPGKKDRTFNAGTGRILADLDPSGKIAEYLAGCTEEQQEKLSGVIDRARRAWRTDGRDKMFSIPETDITVAVVSPTEDPLVDSRRMENMAAVMAALGQERRSALMLYYGEDGALVRAEERTISRQMFSERQWRAVELMGGRLKARF